MKPNLIVWGTYVCDGKETPFEIHFDGDRKAGLKEWCRKALANGGKATKADGAFTLTIKEKQ